NANPEAAIQMHWDFYPSQAPTGDEGKALKENLPVVEDRWEADAAPGTDGLVGYLDKPELEKSISFFDKYRLIDRKVPVDQIDGMEAAKKAAQKLDANKI